MGSVGEHLVTPRGIDSTFAAWLASSEGAERWEDLPHRLSLVRERSASWDDFIRLWPNRDLPTFVQHALPPDHELRARIENFTYAHHYAAMFGIVTDRIVDGQHASPHELFGVRRAFLDAWAAHLAIALADHSLARETIGRALRAWKQGIDLERRQLLRRPTWDEYATAVMLRLRWVSATAVAMLQAAGVNTAADALGVTYDRFLLALQIMDDCDDREEDERCRGASFALADIGLGPRALAGLLLGQSAHAAEAGGLSRLAAWLGEFSSVLLTPGRKR